MWRINLIVTNLLMLLLKKRDAISTNFLKNHSVNTNQNFYEIVI